MLTFGPNSLWLLSRRHERIFFVFSPFTRKPIRPTASFISKNCCSTSPQALPMISAFARSRCFERYLLYRCCWHCIYYDWICNHLQQISHAYAPIVVTVFSIDLFIEHIMLIFHSYGVSSFIQIFEKLLPSHIRISRLLMPKPQRCQLALVFR